MAKIAVSIDDELVEGLRREAAGNVSRFVSNAVREAVSRSQNARMVAVAGTQPEAASRRKAPTTSAAKLAKRARAGESSPSAAPRASGRG